MKVPKNCGGQWAQNAVSVRRSRRTPAKQQKVVAGLVGVVAAHLLHSIDAAL